jgi:hypothetical protein
VEERKADWWLIASLDYSRKGDMILENFLAIAGLFALCWFAYEYGLLVVVLTMAAIGLVALFYLLPPVPQTIPLPHWAPAAIVVLVLLYGAARVGTLVRNRVKEKR